MLFAHKTVVVVLGFVAICKTNCWKPIVQYICAFHCCKSEHRKVVSSSWYEVYHI